jgi:hypothetical protein
MFCVSSFWGEGKSKGRRGGGSGGGGGVRRVKDDGGARARMAAVLSQRGSQLVMTKRVRAVDPFDIFQVTNVCNREGDPTGWSTLLITALGSWEKPIPHGETNKLTNKLTNKQTN